MTTGCSGLRICEDGDPWFGRDKARHFIGSAMVAAGVTIAVSDGRDAGEAAMIGFASSMAAGAAKEVADDMVRGYCFSWKDLFWDFLGASAGATAAAAVME